MIAAHPTAAPAGKPPAEARNGLPNRSKTETEGVAAPAAVGAATAPLSAGASFGVRLAAAIAAAFGILGALLLAMPALPGWGFGAFLVSNLAWLIVSAERQQWALHVQQWVFLLCSLVGLWNWWLGPLLLG